MRFMVLVKASQQTEAGVLPTTEELSEMGQFNEEMVKAGVMQTGEGLHPTAKGARIHFGGPSPAVTPGPFAGAGDLVCGFWIINVPSLADAIGWMKRAPFREGEIEIRQIFADEDFGEAFTPELRAQEQRMRDEIAKGAKA